MLWMFIETARSQAEARSLELWRGLFFAVCLSFAMVVCVSLCDSSARMVTDSSCQVNVLGSRMQYLILLALDFGSFPELVR